MATLTGPHLDPKSGAPADSLVVLLHGRGSSGDDLIGLGDVLADAFPHTAFHAPHGPQPYEDAPFGYQWYSRANGDSPAERFREAASTVNSFVDELLDKHEIDPSRCVLVGFSQGTMVATYVSLRRRRALGGVVGFSGVLAAADTLTDELANKTPLCLVHGAADRVIPSQRAEEASTLLAKLGVPHQLHILPSLGHSIDGRGLQHAIRFIQGVWGQV
jgi:phospholipase/carboxylesterase